MSKIKEISLMICRAIVWFKYCWVNFFWSWAFERQDSQFTNFVQKYEVLEWLSSFFDLTYLIIINCNQGNNNNLGFFWSTAGGLIRFKVDSGHFILESFFLLHSVIILHRFLHSLESEIQAIYKIFFYIKIYLCCQFLVVNAYLGIAFVIFSVSHWTNSFLWQW